MNICLVHNEYGKFSGEEAVVLQQRSLLIDHGHTVEMFTRSSAGIPDSLAAKARAFFSGIYNPASRKDFRKLLDSFKPALVHIHNVFPLISPSIMPETRRAGIPVVMTLHNFRLICPNALLFTGGEICRQCLGGREWRCVVRNCEGSLPKSLGYSVRTALARRFRWFLDNVDVFVCLTDFQRRIYVSEGFPPDRCIVVPNFISVVGVDTRCSAAESSTPEASNEQGTTNDGSTRFRVPRSELRVPFVLYAGRVSPEKDVPALLEAACLLPDIPFRIAGSYWRMPGLPEQAPGNVRFLGEIPSSALSDLYRKATMVIFPTRWYEGFPMVLLEAMSHCKPLVCTDIGGLGEIVDDHVTGRFYRAGNARQLADIVRELWNNPADCEALGKAGRRRMETEYSPDKAYEMLMAAYEMAGRNVERRVA